MIALFQVRVAFTEVFLRSHCMSKLHRFLPRPWSYQNNWPSLRSLTASGTYKSPAGLCRTPNAREELELVSCTCDECTLSVGAIWEYELFDFVQTGRCDWQCQKCKSLHKHHITVSLPSKQALKSNQVNLVALRSHEYPLQSWPVYKLTRLDFIPVERCLTIIILAVTILHISGRQ